MNTYTVPQSAFVHFLTADTTSAPLWLLVRLYLGYEFLMAGWGKLASPAWFGSGAGAALQGFVQGAVAKTVCAAGTPAAACHPDVQMWYASFLQSTVLPHLVVWSNAVVIGELAIGLGLIVGLFTGVAAFFAFFMSLNFMLAGTVSTNPVLIVLALSVFAARRVAGHLGLDRYARPRLGRRFYSPGTQ
ncbi:DoxX family membrane protein [Patescibacteria group bacterium]|nr:DoxX family membrane protein [Patescibacteria group bacterium]